MLTAPVPTDSPRTTNLLSRLKEIHPAAVIVAAIAYFVLGAPWFSVLFGAAWARSIGVQPPETWGLLSYLVPFAGNLVAALTTALLARATGTETWKQGVLLGAIVALGYSSATAGVDAMSPQNPGPGVLFLVTGSYHLVGLMLVGAIVTAWRRAPRGR